MTANKAHDAGLHGRPTRIELVDAVREFLRSDALTAGDDRSRYFIRVAANVLDMVHRELEVGADQESLWRDTLSAAGFADTRSLCEALRARAVTAADEGVWQLLVGSVEAKLRVANPRYLDGAAVPMVPPSTTPTP